MRVSTPIGRLPWHTVIAANVVFWPTWTLAAGFVASRAPVARFAHDDLLTAHRNCERGGDWYRDELRIDRWKDRLPEAGSWFGGFPKREVSRNAAQLGEFVVETRRAESAHWWMAFGVVLTTAWNPWWAFPANAVVAAASNLPCIAVQRYNRARLLRTLRIMSAEST